jgi:hypothetical protein
MVITIGRKSPNFCKSGVGCSRMVLDHEAGTLLDESSPNRRVPLMAAPNLRTWTDQPFGIICATTCLSLPWIQIAMCMRAHYMDVLVRSSTARSTIRGTNPITGISLSTYGINIWYMRQPFRINDIPLIMSFRTSSVHAACVARHSQHRDPYIFIELLRNALPLFLPG